MNRKNSSAVRALKDQAKALRKHLGDRGVAFTHSQALEAVAHTHGHKDWNTAVAACELEDAEQDASDLLDTIHFSLEERLATQEHVKTVERRFRLEHVMQRSGTREALPTIHKYVDDVLSGGGSVAYIDCVMEFIPHEWERHLDKPDQFILHQPENFNDAAPVIKTMCHAGVDLLVLMHPRHLLPSDGGAEVAFRWDLVREEWTQLIESVKNTTGTHMVALNSFRETVHDTRDPVFAPWSTMANTVRVFDAEAVKRKKEEQRRTQALLKSKCPSCEGPVVEKPGMFHSRVTGAMPGLVCESCNALFDNPNNSFLETHLEMVLKHAE